MCSGTVVPAGLVSCPDRLAGLGMRLSWIGPVTALNVYITRLTTDRSYLSVLISQEVNCTATGLGNVECMHGILAHGTKVTNFKFLYIWLTHA